MMFPHRPGDRRRAGGALRLGFVGLCAVLSTVPTPAAAAGGCLDVVGTYDRGPVPGVDVTPQFAYVASGYSLLVVDTVSDPPRPSVVAEIQTSGRARSVDVAGNYAYVAAGAVDVIDISDPAAPLKVASLPRLGASHVEVDGSRLFVIDAAAQLFEIYDLGNPADPVLITGRSFPSTPSSTTVDGSRAYVTSDDGVRIYNLSNLPGLPILGDITSGFANAVVVRGHHAFVVGGSGGLFVFDISTPGAAVQVAQLALEFGNTFVDLTRSGDHLFLSSTGGAVYVVDIADPTSPNLIAESPQLGSGGQLVTLGNRVFSAQLNGGLAVLDVMSPAMPQSVGVLPTPGIVSGMDPQGDLVYLAAGEGGLKMVDVSVPPRLTEAAQYNTLGESRDVQVMGSTAFVADGSRGLLTVDISDPLIPHALDDLPFSEDALAVQVAGDRAFVAAFLDGLRVVDVSFPLLLEEAAAFTDVDKTEDVALEGDLAFLADHNAGLRILDISNPDAPFQVALRDTPGTAVALSLDDSRVLVANAFQPSSLLDIGDPTSPQLLGAIDCDSRRVVLDGDFAYVACQSSVLVVHTGLPNQTFTVTSRFLEGGYSDLALQGDRLFAARGFGGVEMLAVGGCNELLSDGFESGDLSAWSASFP